MTQINNAQYKPIKYCDKTIIFIDDKINRKGFDKTAQLNETIFHFTKQNVIDVGIYIKEKTQDDHQTKIINANKSDDGFKENIDRLLEEIRQREEYILGEYTKEQKEMYSTEISMYQKKIQEHKRKHEASTKQLLTSTEKINNHQLLKNEVELQNAIKENVLKSFDIKPILNIKIGKDILSVKDDEELFDILVKANIIQKKTQHKSNKNGIYMKCICSEGSCQNLFFIRHIETDLYFAVGSDCINRIHPELKKRIDLCIFENSCKKCVKCSCHLISKQYATFVKNYDDLFRQNCYDCYMEVIVSNRLILQKLKNKSLEERMKYLKKMIKEENDLIERNEYRRCKDCDVIVENKDKKHTRCKKCWCIFMKYASKETEKKLGLKDMYKEEDY